MYVGGCLVLKHAKRLVDYTLVFTNVHVYIYVRVGGGASVGFYVFFRSLGKVFIALSTCVCVGERKKERMREMMKQQ